MKKRKRMFLSGRTIVATLLGIVVLGGLCIIPMIATGGDDTIPYDRTEAYGCASCHAPRADVVQPWIAADWAASSHGNSIAPGGHGNDNTYCAKCHSPFEAVAGATYGTKVVVPADELQAVTCGACHPPHDLRVEWGTPIGYFDVPTQEWVPVYHDDPDTSEVEGSTNDLCTNCHTGRHGDKDFKAYGDVMFHKKGVTCVDCHMPEVPVPGSDLTARSHGFKVTEENAEFSCGTITGGCHDNHKTEWAVKQIAKEKMHGKKK